MDRNIWMDRYLQPKVILMQSQKYWIIEASIIQLAQLEHAIRISKKCLMNTHIHTFLDNFWSEEQETYESRRKHLWSRGKSASSICPKSIVHHKDTNIHLIVGCQSCSPDVDEVNILQEIQNHSMVKETLAMETFKPCQVAVGAQYIKIELGACSRVHYV